MPFSVLLLALLGDLDVMLFESCPVMFPGTKGLHMCCITVLCKYLTMRNTNRRSYSSQKNLSQDLILNRNSDTDLKSALTKSNIDFNDKFQIRVSKQNIFIIKKEMNSMEHRVS